MQMSDADDGQLEVRDPEEIEEQAHGRGRQAEDDGLHVEVAVGPGDRGRAALLALEDLAEAERERLDHDRHGLDDAQDAGHEDGPDADVADIGREDLGLGHPGDGDRARIDGARHVLAQEPDGRDEGEVRQQAAGDDDRVVAQADDVAEAEEGREGVDLEDHLGLHGQVVHEGQEAEVDHLVPEADADGQELVDAADDDAEDEGHGLLAPGFAGDQDLGRGRGLGEGELAVLLDAEVAPEGRQEQDAEAAAEEGRQEDLDDVGRQAEDVQGRDGEDGPGDERAGGGADRLEDDVLQDGALPLIDVADADGQDGHRDGRLGDRPDLEAQVGDREGEEEGHEQPPDHGPGGDLGDPRVGGDVGLVGLAGGELLIGFRRQGLPGRLHRGLLSQRVVYGRNSGCETQDVLVYLESTSSLRRWKASASTLTFFSSRALAM